jgi:hypothetical protein
MPHTIFINGEFLEKLCISSWACISGDSVSRRSTGWRYTVTHIGRPPTSVRCAPCSCPRDARCACTLSCIEIPKPTNAQPVAKHFVVQRTWKWVKLKKWPLVCDVLPIAASFVTIHVTGTWAHSLAGNCCLMPYVLRDMGGEPLVINLLLVLSNVDDKLCMR